MAYITISQRVDVDVDLDDIFEELSGKDIDYLLKKKGATQAQLAKQANNHPTILSLGDPQGGHTVELIATLQEIINSGKYSHLQLTSKLQELL